MPIRRSIIHRIDKKPDGSPAALHLASTYLPPSEASDNLLQEFNEAYNAKQGKAWGLFHEESGAYPLSGWLSSFLTQGGDDAFVEFSRTAAEHLTRLMEESNLSVGGHLMVTHYTQGLTDYMVMALLHESESISFDGLALAPSKRIDLSQLHLACRINLTEWRNNPKSKQYISFLKAKGRRAHDYFRDFIGCMEGMDAPSETRTLLKAFSDFVESEDLPEEQAREKTSALVDYATTQAKIGAPITLEELSGLIDEDRPRAFFEHIRNKDYGMAPEFPADKRTLNQFRRFTARAEGLSISFEAHLLGNKVEYDKARNALLIRDVPEQLKQQLAQR